VLAASWQRVHVAWLRLGARLGLAAPAAARGVAPSPASDTRARCSRQDELAGALKDYVGRETPLYFAGAHCRQATALL
jgi:hypothetical protein